MNTRPLVLPWHACPLAGQQCAGCGPHIAVTVCHSPTSVLSAELHAGRPPPLQLSFRALLGDPIHKLPRAVFSVSVEDEQNPFYNVRLRRVKRDHSTPHREAEPVTRPFVRPTSLALAQGIICQSLSHGEMHLLFRLWVFSFVQAWQRALSVVGQGSSHGHLTKISPSLSN